MKLEEIRNMFEDEPAFEESLNVPLRVRVGWPANEWQSPKFLWKCDICFGSLLDKPSAKIVATRCGHIFHQDCFQYAMAYKFRNKHEQRCSRCQKPLKYKIDVFNCNLLDSLFKHGVSTGFKLVTSCEHVVAKSANMEECFTCGLIIQPQTLVITVYI